MDNRAGSPDRPATRNRYVYALNDPIKHIDPCGRSAQPTPCQVGNIADDVIGAWYKLSMTWHCDSIAIDAWLPGGLEAFGVRVAKKQGGLGCRPDIINFCSGEVFEVKPLSGKWLMVAYMEALQYSVALNLIASATGYPTIFSPGFLFVDPPLLGGMEVHGPGFHMIPGAVFYSFNWKQSRQKIRGEIRQYVPDTAYGPSFHTSTVKVQVVHDFAIAAGIASATMLAACLLRDIAVSMMTLRFV
jgi:hypothetical protein